MQIINFSPNYNFNLLKKLILNEKEILEISCQDKHILVCKYCLTPLNFEIFIARGNLDSNPNLTQFSVKLIVESFVGFQDFHEILLCC
jgi:hypothetical protein